MGVPASEVGYTIATTRSETTKVHKKMWWHWEKKIRAVHQQNLTHCVYYERLEEATTHLQGVLFLLDS